VTRWFQTKLAALLVVAAACCIAGGWQAEAQGPGDDDDSRVPGVAWTTVKPETIGYSSPRLESLRSWLKTLDTKAMLVAVHGQVIFEYGTFRTPARWRRSARACCRCSTATTWPRASSTCARRSRSSGCRRPSRSRRWRSTRHSST
jgi:hypothetical protein